MFESSNVFEFINFPFKTKYNSTTVYSVNINYLFFSGKNEKNRRKNSLIKSTVYLLIFRQNSTSFISESYFTGELKVGES